MKDLTEQQLYQRARLRIGFRIHATIYLILIGINWLIWLLFPTTHMWPVWPTLSWGIGLTAHYLSAIGRYSYFSIEDEINQLKHSYPSGHEPNN